MYKVVSFVALALIVSFVGLVAFGYIELPSQFFGQVHENPPDTPIPTPPIDGPAPITDIPDQPTPVLGEPIATIVTGDLIRMSSNLSDAYKMKDDNEMFLQIDLEAITLKSEKRLPLNLCIVIDRSGSMGSEQKLDYTKEAAKFVIDQLTSTDYIAIVVYDDVVETLVPSTRVENKEHLKAVINELYDRGSTNLGGGLLEGIKQVKTHYNSDSINRILLLSDGLANEGITDPVELGKIAQDARERGINTTTLGVGVDFNEDLMANLSDYGGGNYYFIDKPEQIATIFSKELDELLKVIAQNVLITMQLAEGVKLEKIYEYKYNVKGTKVSVPLTDIYSGEERKIVCKLNVPAKDFKLYDALTIKLDYKDALETGKLIEEVASLSYACTEDKKLVDNGHNRKVYENKEVILLAEAMHTSAELIQEGQYEKAKEVLDVQTKSTILANKDYKNAAITEQIILANDYLEMNNEETTEEEYKYQQRGLKSDSRATSR